MHADVLSHFSHHDKLEVSQSIESFQTYSYLHSSTNHKHFRDFFFVCNVTFALGNATFAVIIVHHKIIKTECVSPKTNDYLHVLSLLYHLKS